MSPPQNVKEIQQLAGRVASLNRFISKAMDKCHPFFKVLRQGKSMRWTEDCNEAFEQLKKYLVTPLVLSKPQKEEKLFLYLAVSSVAVSSVLLRQDNGVQRSSITLAKPWSTQQEKRLRSRKLFFYILIYCMHEPCS
ncbi:RNA-directed DNA polymerase [Melia azedarach]|uniref:RNA-directed DNA polymerase n=1 Tax=Melia azedarach TaxID=155640 RepID=A0ACC1XH28_MELAZ|nr:RNA-directed DNA polymerase [Melia azedarach]